MNERCVILKMVSESYLEANRHKIPFYSIDRQFFLLTNNAPGNFSTFKTKKYTYLK